jgi:DNA (cytosine-5)-methyltransferase 1
MSKGSSKKFNVIDLFCGAGGFSEGFRQAGFRIIAGIDNDSQALETYAKNFIAATVVNRDLSRNFLRSDAWIRNIQKAKIDIIIGGPPCQGFSIAGKRLRDDPRNRLYKAYLKFIKLLKPRVLVIENVPTILNLFHGEIAKQIKEDFEGFGYTTTVFSLLASDYGIPQSRKRVFFVGTKGRKSFRMSAPTTPFSPITVEMALSDLSLLGSSFEDDEDNYKRPPANEYQAAMRKGVRKLYNHWAVRHTPKTIEIIKLVPDGGNYKDLPVHLQNTRKVNIAWTRMNSKKPCFTIDAGHNHHFHYKANRVPTVRECARIQSFSDKFRFFGNKTSQFKQVGNAVPPLLAKEIALEVRRVLE